MRIIQLPDDARSVLCYFPDMEDFPKANLSFFGLGIEVSCQDEATLTAIKHDYSYFIGRANPPHAYFKIYNEQPAYDKLPRLKARLYTPRNICYRDGRSPSLIILAKGS